MAREVPEALVEAFGARVQDRETVVEGRSGGDPESEMAVVEMAVPRLVRDVPVHDPEEALHLLFMNGPVPEERGALEGLALHAPDRTRFLEVLVAGARDRRAIGPLLPMGRPYDDAPRLPEGEHVDLRALVSGDWLELEIGPGRGWFLVERAAAEPRAALVGLEIRRKWAAIVDGRLAKRGLAARARVFAEDAAHALARIVPDACVRRVFLHFPDPWWKKRHAKRLVMKDAFLAQVARLLEPGGELFVQTDVEERAAEYEALVGLEPRFVPAGDAPPSPRLADHGYVARSPRERRAIADGLPVHRMRWTRAAG